jgi:hypothetical protein
MSPTPTPTNNEVVALKNDCEVFTLFDMGITCFPIAQPSSPTSLDGILSIKITGGTSPYSIYWAGGQRSDTLVGIPQGDYEVLVIDYYGDYSATTVCSLVAPTAAPTSTPTPTPTVTPPATCVDICFIAIGTSTNYGPIQFICNGQRNGKITWVSSDSNYNVVWNLSRSRWEITGADPTVTFNPVGGGIFASNTTSPIPLAGWSIVGGLNTYNVTMTEGDCPVALPLQTELIVNNTTCNTTTNCNGSITLNTQYGTPPYQYSINNGFTFQISNVFEGLCAGQYNVIVIDSANNIENIGATVGVDGQTVTYQLSLSANTSATQVINFNNYSSRLTFYEVVSTPPLPAGVTITFNLAASTTKTYNGPGSGEFSDSLIITENGIVKSPISSQTSTQTGSRPNCSPETFTAVTDANTYQLTFGENIPVLITSASILSITNGEVGPQSNCLTNLTQETSAQFITPQINGCVCCTVIADDRENNLNTNSLTFTPDDNNLPIRQYVAIPAYTNNGTCSVVDPGDLNGYFVLIYRDSSLGIDNRIGQPGSPFICNNNNRITLKAEPLPNILLLTSNRIATEGWVAAVDGTCSSAGLGGSSVIQESGSWITLIGNNQPFQADTDFLSGEWFVKIDECVIPTPTPTNTPTVTPTTVWYEFELAMGITLEEACDSSSFLTYYSNSPTLGNGVVLRTAKNLSPASLAISNWYSDGEGNVYNISGNDGVITTTTVCPSLTPTPTNTPTLTNTPTPTTTPVIREYVTIPAYTNNGTCTVSDPNTLNGYFVLIYRDSSLGINNSIGQPGSPFICNNDNEITLKAEPLPNTLLLTSARIASEGWVAATDGICNSIGIGGSSVIQESGTWLTLISNDEVYIANTDFLSGDWYVTIEECALPTPTPTNTPTVTPTTVWYEFELTMEDTLNGACDSSTTVTYSSNSPTLGDGVVLRTAKNLSPASLAISNWYSDGEGNVYNISGNDGVITTTTVCP